ncbi:peptidoglycan-associated lipoprotein Pal [Candidatus Njordibacter sp. Uisw_058]|uniref:peptidoglycan-associated lipoprotein Pal n=1 Tax=Candidatus Njordibacter sp. Uisw_058 TaxID=3230974 RepID=UPI003D50926D
MQKVNLSKIVASSALVAFLAACSSTGETTDARASAQAAQVAVEAAPLAQTQADAQALKDAQALADAEAAQQAADNAVAQVAAQKQQAQEAAQALAHIIYFDFDQSTIKPEFRTALNSHAAYLSQNLSARIVLEGHADERGTREYNIALGERRGIAVSRYLVVQGVSIEAIEVVSFGEERPVNSGSESASLSENRRVEVRYVNF